MRSETLLDSARPVMQAPTPSAAPIASSLDPARAERIAALRERIQALMDRSARTVRAGVPPNKVWNDALPFVQQASHEGPVHLRTRMYDAAQRHGLVPLHTALEATGEAVATLALDASLRHFDPANALFLDTETTGLSGGTGTLAFLVGTARFDGRKFRVEQLFLAEPCNERAMLAHLGERMASASALVTYNGKAFDLPLLRARFVLARLPPPPELPHLDLLHVARRIYGSRVDECKLTHLERDVLGFVREGDVPPGEIPARYAHFLRYGDPTGLLAVIEHNLWDVIAMAALLGELSARVRREHAPGRFEPDDITGLARTAFRARDVTLAARLARDAVIAGKERGRYDVAVRASTLAAQIHRRQGDHHATLRQLLDALALAPDDGSIHLALAKLYEHKFRDFERALHHARLAATAEPTDAHVRRIARLTRRLARTPLRLPGIASSLPAPARSTENT